MADEQLGNSLAAKARPFIADIEAIEAEMLSMIGEHMAALKGKRAERKDIYVAAKDAGVPTQPLKGYIKRRRLERKIEEIPADFDLDEAAAYRELADGALGDLGVAAAAKAGYGNGQDDDRDLRPPHMQRTEQERKDADALGKVGRGA
jgi:hypothetical protein